MCIRDRDNTFYDNPTEYVTEIVKAKLRKDYSNNGKLGASRLDGSRFYGFSEEYIAAVYPAAGGGKSPTKGPVDVCNSLVFERGKSVTAYDVSANFRAPHPVSWKYSRSANPEYPASKWPGPGAIAIGKDDALFVVDGTAIGLSLIHI